MSSSVCEECEGVNVKEHHGGNERPALRQEQDKRTWREPQFLIISLTVVILVSLPRQYLFIIVNLSPHLVIFSLRYSCSPDVEPRLDLEETEGASLPGVLMSATTESPLEQMFRTGYCDGMQEGIWLSGQFSCSYQ